MLVWFTVYSDMSVSYYTLADWWIESCGNLCIVKDFQVECHHGIKPQDNQSSSKYFIYV